MSSLRIVVSGMAITYPFGGVFWDYVQYVLGLRRLGHEVLYVEDTGQWCYDPTAGTFVADGTRNARRFARSLAALDPDLAEKWHFRDATGTTYGTAWEATADFCATADLFLNVSAACIMRDLYRAATRIAVIDSDPMYTQASIPDYVAGTADEEARSRVDLLRRHDVFFTFGENVGAPECRIPTALFDWIPTRQPIVRDIFQTARVPLAERRRVLTTVASWEPKEAAPRVDGITYEGKRVEFERFIKLPAHSALPLELALSGAAPRDRLRRHGWQVRDGFEVSDTPWHYRDYLARSFGEWSVAKHAYVASRSGWFSGRTACYLALGVPAIVHDTGCGAHIPAGEGILLFQTMEEAAAATAQFAGAPQHHANAARAIADEYFDSDKVLTRLIEHAMNAG